MNTKIAIKSLGQMLLAIMAAITICAIIMFTPVKLLAITAITLTFFGFWYLLYSINIDAEERRNRK